MKIALGVEYAGEHFCGWQTQQTGVRTVQTCVEQALSNVANHEVKTVCAGRTDTGVHAMQQIIHVDVKVERPLKAWVWGTNANLPKDVRVLWAKVVDDAFHARFSATARHYRYLIFNRSMRSALLNHKVTWVHKALDTDRMQQAGNFLIGTHDFTSYRATACQAKSPIRTVTHLQISPLNQWIVIDVSANGFLHHMVRNIVGVLIHIGAGDKPINWSQEVLEARDRKLGGITAPASGLYLRDIDYPEPYTFPKVDNDFPLSIFSL